MRPFSNTSPLPAQLHGSLRTSIQFILIGLITIVALQLARYLLITQAPSFRNGEWYATIDDFRLVHLRVNYFDHGYLRRGLVGTCLRLFGVQDVSFAGWLLSLASILAFFGIIGAVAAKLLPDRRRVVFVIMMMMVLGPAGAPQFISDAGRTDHLLAPLAALSAIAGIKGRVLISIILYSTMCLIHELSVIAFAPLLTACNILGAKDTSDVQIRNWTFPLSTSRIAAFSLVTLVAICATLFFGNSPEAVHSLANFPGEMPLYGEMLWGDDSPVDAISWVGAPSLLLAAYYVILISWAAAYSVSLNKHTYLLPLSVLPCLLLNFVGVDAGRWAVITTWALVIAVLAAELATHNQRAKPVALKPVFWLGLILSLPVGPLGVTTPFDFILRFTGIQTL